jgi:putative spermidine/putrescine transport system substrate-binding protein
MFDSPLSRRRFLTRMSLVAGGALVAPSVLAACGSPSTGGAGGATASALPADVNARWPQITSREVVLAGFGGETYQIRDEESFAPFAEVSGARVVQAPWDYGRYLQMVAAPNPEWDMIDFDGYSVAALVQGGTPPARLADWVRRSDLVDPAYQDYAGGSYAYSVVLGWSTDLPAAPTGWADFFDTARFPGKRAFPRSIYAGTAEIALLADGVPKEQMYPLDLDRAFAKLDTIKNDIIFYDSYAQGQQYMAQGSASMIAIANSRMIQLKDSGRPIDWTYQDAILYPWGGFPITQNAPHMDAANALVDYLSTPEVQAMVARRLFLGPTVSAAFDQLTPEEQALQPSAPANVAMQLSVDVEALATQDVDYVTRFTAWVGE